MLTACLYNFFFKNGKLQIIPLMFKSLWILYLDVLEFRFYPLKYRGVWILLLKVLGCLDFTS